jgi:hypothetical protein
MFEMYLLADMAREFCSVSDIDCIFAIIEVLK